MTQVEVSFQISFLDGATLEQVAGVFSSRCKARKALWRMRRQAPRTQFAIRPFFIWQFRGVVWLDDGNINWLSPLEEERHARACARARAAADEDWEQDPDWSGDWDDQGDDYPASEDFVAQ